MRYGSLDVRPKTSNIERNELRSGLPQTVANRIVKVFLRLFSQDRNEVSWNSSEIALMCHLDRWIILRRSVTSPTSMPREKDRFISWHSAKIVLPGKNIHQRLHWSTFSVSTQLAAIFSDNSRRIHAISIIEHSEAGRACQGIWLQNLLHRLSWVYSIVPSSWYQAKTSSWLWLLLYVWRDCAKRMQKSKESYERLQEPKTQTTRGEHPCRYQEVFEHELSRRRCHNSIPACSHTDCWVWDWRVSVLQVHHVPRLAPLAKSFPCLFHLDWGKMRVVLLSWCRGRQSCLLSASFNYAQSHSLCWSMAFGL